MCMEVERGEVRRARGGRLQASGRQLSRCRGAARRVLIVVVLGCSAGEDETRLQLPEFGAYESSSPFLNLPASAAESAESPSWLSDTGAFAALAGLEVAPGVLPYSVQSPLWSDGAEKQRWIAVPGQGPVGFSEGGAWTFPEGTVLIKQFDMVLDERTPELARRLETRFLVAARDGYYGLVYRWDDDQRDARLLLDGAEDVLEIVRADGSVREQRYMYPSVRACRTCHAPEVGVVMGVRTAQLNGEHDYGASGRANQLAVWASRGLFDVPVGERPLGEYARLVPLDDESAPLEARVRSYWDANCSSCHHDASAIPSWDARFSTPLEQQGVLMAQPLSGPRPDDARLIVPGEPERSLIYLRSLSTEPGVRMPPVLKNRTDERYVELLREWIASLPPAR